MYKFSLSSILAIASCSLCGLFAHESVEQRLSELEKEMADVYGKNTSGTAGAIFAPGKKSDADCGWYVDAEVLLWHVKSGATDWVIVFDQNVPPSNGNMKSLGFGWDWGLRVGLGKYFNHDGWDSELLYTYYRTADSSSVSVPFNTPEGTDAPAGSPGPSGVSDGNFAAKVSYNGFDLSLGKSYFTSKTTMVHPRFGLKNVWLVEKYKLKTSNFVDATQTFVPVSGTILTNLENTNKVWGIGPEIGVDFSWFLCNNFKLLSTIEGALLQSYIQSKQQEGVNIAPIGADPLITSLEVKGNMHRFIPFGRLLVGLGWGDYINEGQQHFDVSLNYEVNYFWRENQMINETNADPSAVSLSTAETVRLMLVRLSEDIGFYGVTFKVQIDF